MRPTRTMDPRSFALALAAAAACATSGGAHEATATASQPLSATPSARSVPSPSPSPSPTKTQTATSAVTQPAAPRRELSPRAQRLFDEAVAAADEQRRLKIPTDWEVLERRWRAVTEAEAVPEAWFNLGLVLEKRRRPDEARAAYRRALDLEPALAPAAVNLALLDEPKDPREAAQAWAELMRRFPDDPVPRSRLAALYEASGQHDAAWKLAREALLRDPRALGAYKVMMRVALERRNLDLAQLLAVKARKLDDADPEVVAFVGDVLLAQHDEPGAVSQWKKAVALKDDFLPARYALLASALAKQHWEGVAEQARAILRSDPDDARVQLALGVAYRYLGQPDKALAAYDQAERLAAGKLPEVHLARGVVLMKSKEQCEPALVELRRYVVTAGPAVASEGPAMRLQRECEQILAATKQAEEAAREMKAEAEREAAKKGAAPNETRPAAAKGNETQPEARPVESPSAAGGPPAPTR
jgi:tetratricopeptide (TPR) repeat protein